MSTSDIDLKSYIRAVADFPKPGILFRDITPLLRSPEAFRYAIAGLCEPYRNTEIDVIVGAEARGFLFGPPMALELGVGFVPVRKPGKLPSETRKFSYELEYGTDTLEIHVDGVQAGNRVLIVDDLLATGGTVEACCKLITQANATVVGCAFLIELKDLGGASRIAPHKSHCLLQY